VAAYQLKLAKLCGRNLADLKQDLSELGELGELEGVLGFETGEVVSLRPPDS
jgi:hypothetical protein